MTSIKQKPAFSMEKPGAEAGTSVPQATRRLPDFRNMGIDLRIIIVVNVFMALAAILQTQTFPAALSAYTEISAFCQPALLLSLGLLYATYPWLKRLGYPLALALAALQVLLAIVLIHEAGAFMLGAESMPPLGRTGFLGLIAVGLVAYYLHLHYRALVPAIAEARLQALQARIRPHFLFNSLNAVLSLIRSQPQRAEAALEDMAELFRVLMADNRELVPLAQEIALCRQYLALEKLRLEERLQVSWQVDTMPPDAMIPPLVLQPLLENAVYHGIEPLAAGGEIVIHIYSQRHEVHLVIRNPYPGRPPQHHGNRMALANIRERLALHFDAEASLKHEAKHGQYVVHIVIPYHRQGLGA